MSTAIWTYQIEYTLSDNKGIPKTLPSIDMTIKRTSPASVDPSFYKLAQDTGHYEASRNSAQTNNPNKFKLKFGDYCKTDDIEMRQSWHTISGTMTNYASILNVGTSGVTVPMTIDGVSSATYDYIYCGTSFVITLDVHVEDKYAASTFTVGSVDFGSNSVVTFSNPNISDLKHVVTWTIVNKSNTNDPVETATGDYNATFQIPSSWMDQVPNGTSVEGTVRVTTYRGQTQIGATASRTFTANVPSTVIPTLTSVTATIKDENQGIPGAYIQNTTGVYLQINGATAGTGATIPADTSHYVISANVEETYVFDSTNIKYTINRLASYGEITFNVTVVDSRGRRSAPKPCTINVMEYALPVISSATAYRCRQDGVAAEDGTYACIRIVASYTETGGNTMDIDSKYYDTLTPTTLVVAQNDMTSGVSYIIGGGLLNTERSYHIKFIVTDSLGNVINKDIAVQSAAYAIHVKNGGSGVAFGKTSEYDNCVEINEGWDFRHMGFIVLPVIYKATAAARDAIQNPPEGLVCLIPKT